VPLHDFVRRSTSALSSEEKRSDYDTTPLRWRTGNELKMRGIGVLGTARVFTMFGLTVAPSKPQ
jgi:hypothetical protein